MEIARLMPWGEASLFVGSIPTSASDADRIASLDIQCVACLLEEPDVRLSAVAEIEARGVKVERFPIRDHSIPESFEAVEAFLARLAADLDAGRSVLIHCLAGLGRSGVIAGALMVRRGLSVDETFERLLAARGPWCPETPAQRAFVRLYAERVAAGRRG